MLIERIITVQLTILVSVSVAFSGEIQRPASSNVARGTFEAMILLVRFADHVNRTLPSRQYFQGLCEGGLQRYLQLQSYNQYNITCHVTDWHTIDETEAFWAGGVSGIYGPDFSASFAVSILDELDGSSAALSLSSSSSSFVDWTRFDRDGDSILDSVTIIHSGFPAEAGDGTGIANCNANAIQDRIRSQGYAYSTAWEGEQSGMRLSGYAIASAFETVCDTSKPAPIGVWAHEWLHTLGTLDLYDQKPTGMIGGLGNFDIMANPFGPAHDGNAPGSLSPYSKLLCGWITPTEILANGVYEIRPSNRYATVYTIQQGFPQGEYLLIEYRLPVDFDEHLFGNGGLLIYRVDVQQPLQQRPGFPGQSGWPANGNNYQVALLQADGKYDLERGINNGDAGDFWRVGMTLGPGDGITFPNTDSYQNGQITRTGIAITVLSVDKTANTVRFRVTGMNVDAPSPTSLPTLAPTIPVPDITTEAPTITGSGAGSKPEPLSVAPTPIPSVVNTINVPLPTSTIIEPTEEATLPPTRLTSSAPVRLAATRYNLIRDSFFIACAII